MYAGSQISRSRLTRVLGVASDFNYARIMPRHLVSTTNTMNNYSPTCIFVFVRTVTSTTIDRKVPHGRTCGFTSRAILNDTGVILRANERPKSLGSVIYSPTKAAVRNIHALRGDNFHDTMFRTLATTTRGNGGLWFSGAGAP